MKRYRDETLEAVTLGHFIPKCDGVNAGGWNSIALLHYEHSASPC